MPPITASEIIFLLTLAATFAAALIARRHAARDTGGGLAEIKLNRWLVGLSAGTTGNSGFIVTGAVGLGYSYGLQWVLLPLSWMLGDLLFWYVFPARINAVGRESRATTLSELLTHGLKGRIGVAIALLTALIIFTCLSGYTSAQWLAGQKFLSGAFALPEWAALALFALLIIGYSSLGGFRGSVYTDTLQAFIRIIGTVIALVAVGEAALADRAAFWHNIDAAGGGFMKFFPGGIGATAAFIGGWACAATGFGLGQPQILSRYLAGRSPNETRGAWWIYIAFVQSTWIAMTVFGIILRGVMPGIEDGEAGLSLFFRHNIGPVLTGIIVADIFATIASTSNGLLVAMSQAIIHDLIPRLMKRKIAIPLSAVTLFVGLLTMGLSVAMRGTTVTNMVLVSISMMGAALAPAVMIRVMRWPYSGASLLGTIVAGLSAALLWRFFGLSPVFNEAGIGIATGLAVNYLIAVILPRKFAR
jgi:sodium/proline symporter